MPHIETSSAHSDAGASDHNGRIGPAAIDMDAATFREIGHRLIDDVAGLLESIRQRKVAPGLAPSMVRQALPRALPETGSNPSTVIADATELLFRQSTFNGHPRFFGYITASAAPIGILGDLLAAAINPNMGAWTLSPAATEIELQTIRWIAELIGYPADCGGIFVSGGNMANIVCLLAARTAALGKKSAGDRESADQATLRLYTSTETHTWIEKAADIAGLSRDAIRWIPVDSARRLRVDALNEALAEDRRAGLTPFLIMGTAGSTGTGSIDPLLEIAKVARRERVWFHVDGAYGAPVATLPDAPADLAAMRDADSVAIDPHKWLYAPLEAGCALVRSSQALSATFAHRPSYYHFDEVAGEEGINFHELGPQNSRGFRALKVWLGLRHVGRAGYVDMIQQDIGLARQLYDAASAHERLDAVTLDLSIATFAYVPPDLRGKLRPNGWRSDSAGGDGDANMPAVERYLNDLNTEVLSTLQERGDVFLSNAVVDGRFLLRACIVNFRTTNADVAAVPAFVTAVGDELDARMRPAELRG